MTTLKRFATTGMVVVFVAFANAAVANANGVCVEVGGNYFLSGVRVPKDKCAGGSQRMKRTTEPKGTYVDKCVGKPKGYKYLDVGPDGKRMAEFTCRG